MHPMAQENIARFTANGKKPGSARLCRLLQMVVSGDGELLRLSTRRSVFRLRDEDRDWVLKLDAPERSFETIRARLRRPPLARESRNWKLLCKRWPELQPLLGVIDCEQLDASRGCFARLWFEGRRGHAWTLEDCDAVGAGMAALHQHGWTDVDLSPNDLLLDACANLIPLDMGHAHVGAVPASCSDRRRDWVHLLGGFTFARRNEFAYPMLNAYRKVLRLRERDEEILRQALLWTSAILHRQSRRCLRQTRDFEPQQDGILRTENIPQGELSMLEGGVSSNPRDAFRLLYELELHDIAALRPLHLQIADCGDWVIEGVLPTPSATLQADLLTAGYSAPDAVEGFLLDPRSLERVKPQA